jgi:hypothetical protein
MASGDGSTDGTTPSTPAAPDNTSYVDTSSAPTTSPSNPWTGLTAQGKSQPQTLTMAPDSARACAKAADKALSRIRGIESATNLLYLRPSMGEYPTGYLPSGTQMAKAFNDRATKLEDCLKRHEVVLQGMIDTFHAADKSYKATDTANAGLFGDSPSSVASASLALDSASMDLDPSISPSSVLPSGVAYDPDKTAPTSDELYTGNAQLPGVIHDEHGIDHLDNHGVLKSMDGDSQRASVGVNPALAEPTRVFDAPLSVNVENSDSLHRDDFYHLYLSIDYAQVMHAAAQWLYLSQQLSMGMKDLQNDLQTVFRSKDPKLTWQGTGAAQADQASADYVNSAQDLADSMKIMGSKLIFTAEWLNQFWIMLPNKPDYSTDPEPDWRHHFDQFYKPGATASMANMPKMPMPVDATTGSTATNTPTNPAAAGATGLDQSTKDEIIKAVDDEFAKNLKDSGLDQATADYKKYADAAAAAAGTHYTGAPTGGATGTSAADAAKAAAAKAAAANQPTPLEQQILTRLDKLEAQAAKQPNSNYQVPTANPPGPLERIAQPIQGRPTSPLDGQTQSGTGTGVTGNAGDPVYPASYNPYAAQQNQAELGEMAAIGQQVAGAFQQFTNLLAQEVQQLTPSIERALDAVAHHDVMDPDAQVPGGHDHAGPGPDEPPRAQARMFPGEGLLADTPIAAAGQAVDSATDGADTAQDDAIMQVGATAEPSVDA